MLKRLMISAVVLMALLTATVPALAQRAGPGEDICAVPPGTLPFDEVAVGIIEQSEGTASRSDAYALEGPDGSSSNVQSDVVDLDDYVGQRVTVYIASAPGNGEPLRNVVRVGPPPTEPNLAVAFCDRAAELAEMVAPGTTGKGASDSDRTAYGEDELPASSGAPLPTLAVVSVLLVSGGLLLIRSADG